MVEHITLREAVQQC